MGGLPRQILPATPRMAAEYAANYGWETAALRGASPYRTNPNGNPYGNPAQVGYPSNYQGFPSLPADFLTWLSSPAGVVVANAIGGYLCANVGNQLDAFALGPALVQAGGALDSHEAVGLAQANSFVSKVAIELLGGAERYADAGTAFGDVNGGAGAVLTVFRVNPNASAADRWIFSKYNGANGYGLVVSTGHLIAYAFGATTQGATLAMNICDGGWHYALTVVDDVAKTISLFSDLGNVTSAAYLGSVTNNGSFTLGYTANSFSGQIAACYLLNVALPASAGTAYWRHGLLHAPFLHARTGPMIAPISAHRVGLWTGGNVGQPCLAYDASLASAANGNAQGSGYMAEDGVTFEAVGSDSLYTNTNPSTGAKASVDGPSGMRDGCRITMNAAWLADIAWCPNAGVGIVGVSNIPWRGDINYRRATVGTTARVGLYFSGSVAGPEIFTLVADAASPVDWIRAGGTCTPVNADQTKVYSIFGAALITQDCDFGEPAVVKNRTTAPLAWRRVGTAAAAATVIPAYEVVNTNNQYFSPLRGRIRLVIGNFQGDAGATFLQFGASAAAGSLTADYNAGQLRLRMYDGAAGLIATLNCGAVNTARHVFDILYDSVAPIRGGAAGGYIVVKEGATILGEGGAAWVAQVAAVTPLWIGSLTGTHAARCLIELAQCKTEPGSVQD
jgi:hypothetical protein